jgi:putative transposase
LSVLRAPQGAESNYTNRAREPDSEPLDHAIGRSRGGLSTKIHQLVDGHGRPLVIALSGGQAGDSPMLKVLLEDLSVARLGPGRPRTRPDALLGDKAYSSRANRALLRAKRITAVIPQPSDQIANRQRRGSAGGRPPSFDATAYKARNVVERSFNDHKQWRGLATRYDKLATVYRGGVVLRTIVIWLRQ